MPVSSGCYSTLYGAWTCHFLVGALGERALISGYLDPFTPHSGRYLGVLLGMYYTSYPA